MLDRGPAVVYTRQAAGGGPPLLGISVIYGPRTAGGVRLLALIEFDRNGAPRGLSL